MRDDRPAGALVSERGVWWAAVNFAVEMLAGVASSVLAVALIEAYLFGRTRMRHRPLRWLLGSARGPMVIVAPSARLTNYPAGWLATHDALGIAHLLTACARIDQPANVVSAGRIPDDPPPNVVALGGPVSNAVTDHYLRRHFPGVVPCRRRFADGRSMLYLRCGDKEFVDGPATSYNFIARVRAGGGMTVTMAWGSNAPGTASAAYALDQHADLLKALDKETFVVVIAFDGNLGYRFTEGPPIDITDLAVRPVDLPADRFDERGMFVDDAPGSMPPAAELFDWPAWPPGPE